MSLFIVQHRHEAERCPVRHPRMAPMLLQHLTPDRDSVARFMQPFAQTGTVEILPAARCEAVVSAEDAKAEPCARR